MSIEERVRAVRARIDAAARAAGRDPGEITLCAATKVQTSDAIRQAIAAGVPVCGENRVQEMTAHLADDAYAGPGSTSSATCRPTRSGRWWGRRT